MYVCILYLQNIRKDKMLYLLHKSIRDSLERRPILRGVLQRCQNSCRQIQMGTIKAMFTESFVHNRVNDGRNAAMIVSDTVRWRCASTRGLV